MSTPAQMQQLLRDLQPFIEKPRTGWILRPERVENPLPLSASKLGGAPFPGRFDCWPECPMCQVPLNFILQIHQHQFPQMWFPEGKDLFQVFRCPDAFCDADRDHADRFMLSFFVKSDADNQKQLKRPSIDLNARCRWPEKPLDEHALTCQEIADYPSFYEGREAWWGKSWKRFQRKHTTGDIERDRWFYDGEFWSLIPNHEATKIEGLPSWQQSGYPPRCRCRQTKELIFQLSSFDRDSCYEQLCIGDAGNIYYFVCARCGEGTLETCWDCG